MPTGLLQAVSDQVGGRLAIVIGAGCSIEAPTCIPLARDLSREAHRKLVLNGVLQGGECPDPENLALLASIVFDRTGSQEPLVTQLPMSRLRLARPNAGYLTLVALMAEKAVSYVLSLNFDLAVENAAAQLGATVEVVERADQPISMSPSIIHLHGSVSSHPDQLVLRQETLDDAWRGAWQQVVSNQVLAAPNVLFVGLGSSAPVLTETIQMISTAVGTAKTIYQADICEHDVSFFAGQLNVPADRYVQRGWSGVMTELGDRVAAEQVHTLTVTGDRVLGDNHASIEEREAFAELADMHADLPLLGLGRLRALAKLDERSIYVPRSEELEEHLVEPLTSLGMACREFGVVASPSATGAWRVSRDGRHLIAGLVVTGRGTRRLVALEGAIRQIAAQTAENTLVALDFVVVGGTQPEPAMAGMQVDLIADDPPDDLISGPSGPRIIVANDPAFREDFGSLLNVA